jgi:hypothetical protein
MPTNIFISLLSYYDKTGINLLDDYSNMIYLSWNFKEKEDRYENIYYFTLESINKILESISKLQKSKLFNLEWILEKEKQIDCFNKELQDRLLRKINQPRIDACKFTSLKEVKDFIYLKYGKKCLCCGSEKNISLDHIIPIKKGGKNTLDNLQPLCKSCNSKKGIKIIDYR